jgi:hypothetical protein
VTVPGMISGPAVGRMPRCPGRVGRLAGALLAALAAVLLGAAPAQAHGGPIRLEVTGDGADRVDTVVTWKKDGHPVTDPVALTLVAAPASGGPRVSPVRMMSSGEGQSFYISQSPLPKGTWRVTVTATAPAEASVTKIVTLHGPPAHLMQHEHGSGHAHAHGGDEFALGGLIVGTAVTLMLVVGTVWRRVRRRLTG